jgi:type II secretory pathway pseudopilin PulG
MAMLTAIALPTLRGARERSAVARARSDLFLLAQALEDYRRAFGDYPQTGDSTQASIECSSPATASHAQVRLFNALSGYFGPTAFAPSDQIRGRAFLDETRFVIERDSAGDSPTAAPTIACVLDPWGRRYLYFYKSPTNPQSWKANGYLLFSAGPDGKAALPDSSTGLMSRPAAFTAENADNVSANEGPP